MNYLVVVNDISLSGRTVWAEEIWRFLFSQGVWIFAENAPGLRHFRIGDTLIIYLAGNAGGHAFVGEAQIASDVVTLEDDLRKKVTEKGLTWFTKAVAIKNVKAYSPTRPIQPVLSKLSFIKDKKNYGLSLRQGVRQLSDRDAKIIRTRT